MSVTSLQRTLIGALVITTLGMLVGFGLYYTQVRYNSTKTVNLDNLNRNTAEKEPTSNSNIDYSGDKAAFDNGYAAGTVDGASKSSVVGQRLHATGTGRVVLQYEDGYMQGYIYGCGQSGKNCAEMMTWFSKAMEIQASRYTN